MSFTLDEERAMRRDSSAAELVAPNAESTPSTIGMGSEAAKRANLDIPIISVASTGNSNDYFQRPKRKPAETANSSAGRRPSSPDGSSYATTGDGQNASDASSQGRNPPPAPAIRRAPTSESSNPPSFRLSAKPSP